jgi:MoxR-like ATPase
MIQFKNEAEAADALHVKYQELKAEIGKVIVGQDAVVHLVITSLFCHAHSLLIGVPGLAKTLLINTVSSAMNLNFNRIQFTPDLMPSDILGAETLDSDRNFKFIKGPIFNNIILADEINRTPPKTQAALLEAMQEKNVTIAGQSYQLPNPFFVLATQNPIEQEGTYPLPEAQLDRFMFNITLDYPSYEDELSIVKNAHTISHSTVKPVITAEEILFFQTLVEKVPVAHNVVEFAVKLVQSTRPNTEKSANIANDYLEWGAGPRASQFLVKAAQCNALMSGKYSPDIEDVRAVAIPILRHRLVKNFKADAEGFAIETIITNLMDALK